MSFLSSLLLFFFFFFFRLLKKRRPLTCFAAQMQTWEDRDRNWRNLRQPAPTQQRKKLTRRLTGRLW